MGEPTNEEKRLHAVERAYKIIKESVARLGFEESPRLLEYLRMPPRTHFGEVGYIRDSNMETLWACSVTIDVRLKKNTDKRTATGYAADCVIGWASTHRTVSQATVAVAAYQRAIELAAIIELAIS